MGISTSERCFARASDGLPAGCNGNPRKASPRTPASGAMRLRLRRHAAAERFAPGKKCEPRAASRGLSHGGPHGGMSHRRRIRPPAAFLHVRKLIAQGRDTTVAKAGRDPLHEFVGHPRAGAMGEDKARPRSRRSQQQRGDRVCAIDFQSRMLRADDVHDARAGSRVERLISRRYRSRDARQLPIFRCIGLITRPIDGRRHRAWCWNVFAAEIVLSRLLFRVNLRDEPY